ncbi:hypothetical protein CQW23_18649 [Capsicum baccatum]|uniref:LOB domain-containing protein n=1 Tax=Capsicum baccatum TaxID=33114 RepID=A0A2G2W3J4_CAPBA|nr:hypothetical protein CQW23_18649 [Capsicum baccatum]
MADQDEEVDHPPEDANGNTADQNEEPLFDFAELPQHDFEQLLQDTDEHPLDHHEIPQGLDQQPLEYQHHQHAHVIHDQPENAYVHVDHHLDDLAVHQDPPPLEPQHQAMDNHNNAQPNPDPLDILQDIEPPPLQGDHRCGACKGGRNQTCPSNCRFRPYFPPNSTDDYVAIIRTFSRANIERWANEISIGEGLSFSEEELGRRNILITNGKYGLRSSVPSQAPAAAEQRPDANFQPLRAQPPAHQPDPIPPGTSQRQAGASTRYIGPAVQHSDADFQPLQAQPPAHQPDPIPPGTSQAQDDASTSYIGYKRCR